ncbi:MAG: hypothetical protein U0T82_08275 [Bacteroidales bacterium]
MKTLRFLSCLTTWILIGMQSLISQTVLQGFSFQGIARDNAGNELVNKSLTLKLAVVSDSAKGTVQWEETHNITTNQYGIYNLTIGKGTSTGNGAKTSFSEMDWGSAYHFLKVSIDFGTGLLDMGTMQLIPVPYALYAEKSGEGALGEVKMFALSMTGAVTKEALQAKGWAVCDGTSPLSQGISGAAFSATPDLRQKFIRASNDATSGSTGGQDNITVGHSHNMVGSSSGPSGKITGGNTSNLYFQTYTANADISFDNRPAYYSLVFFMKVK